MKLSDLMKKIRDYVSESSLAQELGEKASFHISFCFGDNSPGRILIGAIDDCDIDLIGPLVTGSNPREYDAAYAKNMLRIAETKDVYLSETQHVHRCAREIFVYHYPDGNIPEPDDDCVYEQPWLEIFVAISGGDDDKCKVLEEEIIEVICEYFDGDRFRSEVYY